MTQDTAGKTIQNLVVSGIRLSTGLTLYGFGQAKKVFEAPGTRGLHGAAATLASVFDEFADAIENHLDEDARETLRSVTRMSDEAIDKALGCRPTTFARSASDATLAVDILSGPAGA